MEINTKIQHVETLRLFGSYARGEQSEFSDYDVLVVLNQSQIINDELEEKIAKLFTKKISISWYSKKRIETLFRMGHLFAWHLYLESKTFNSNIDFISKLGAPKQYSYSYQDIWSLIEILKPIKHQIIHNPRNLVYEMGIVYVCARNMAICALPSFTNKYTFSAKAPYTLDFPVSKKDFDLLISCRYASSRGLIAPNLTPDFCLNLYEDVWKWGCNLLEETKKNYHGNYKYKKKV